ncbi:hypothetical protein Tco_0231085 [Tanacetum coccineum]
MNSKSLKSKVWSWDRSKSLNVVCEKSSKEIKKTPGAIIIEDWVSDDEEQDECKLKKKIVIPTAAKIEFVRPKQQEKPARKPVKYAEMYRLYIRRSATKKKIKEEVRGFLEQKWRSEGDCIALAMYVLLLEDTML